ncbi:MAG: hypothetical protein JJE10_01810 [Thermoleophilia bacterium]|nr:hypothetical protein [Thermoleophilia bacterium]
MGEKGDSDEDEGITDRVRSGGERAASDFAQALIGSPGFGQALAAAAAARDRATEAQRAAMGALNVSSQDEADRLERRLRSLSDRLEETEDRLDRALDEIRQLRREADSGKGDSPEA